MWGSLFLLLLNYRRVCHLGRRGVGPVVRELISRLAEQNLLVNRSVIVVLPCKYALRVEVISISRNLQILMNPVPVLLHNVPVKLVDHKLSALPGRVGRTAPPRSHTRHTHHPEVLVELRLVYLPDTEPPDRNQTTRDLVRVVHETNSSRPYRKRTQEVVGFDVALQKVVEVTREGESE